MPLSAAELFERIARGAADLGLGAAAALPLREAGDDRLRAWLDAGHAGEMDWIARHAEQRLDPARHFEPHISVVSFLAPYDPEIGPSDPGLGNIARYARGDDYHEVLKKKLFRLMDDLRAEDEGLRMRAFVDTAPLLEKHAAARAGLGWQGKHSNIIREQDGSYFFLAEMLINRELPRQKPATDRCGVCDDCIRACPTGAIVAPYVVDARLCISYLTIELRGVVPRELRRFIGNRIFGCDDCQEVCPWNRHARLDPLAEFLPRAGLVAKDLASWLEMDLEAWRLQFRKSAVKRTKYAGFRRNVAIAIGNAGDVANLAAIARVHPEADVVLRAHLVWALRKIGGAEASQLLSELVKNETEPLVLVELEGEVDQPLS